VPTALFGVLDQNNFLQKLIRSKFQSRVYFQCKTRVNLECKSTQAALHQGQARSPLPQTPTEGHAAVTEPGRTESVVGFLSTAVVFDAADR
jgi:hypothetical protein